MMFYHFDRRALRRMSVRVTHPRFFTACPVLRISAFLHQTMKRRIWPVCHTFNQAVFHRIDMHIIHVRTKIRFVANQAFPIAALPDTSFTAPFTNLGNSLCSRQRFGKAHFDQPPASGKIGIVWWQFDHAMQMIRQHYPAVNRKGVTSPHRTHGVAQQVNMPC